MEDQSKVAYGLAVVALIIGLAGGYYYGNSKGRTDLLAEQKAAEEKAQVEAQEELAEAANPFGGAQVNPFEGSYTNPLKASVNPFAQ